jgi:hypothetical protein
LKIYRNEELPTIRLLVTDPWTLVWIPSVWPTRRSELIPFSDQDIVIKAILSAAHHGHNPPGSFVPAYLTTALAS